MSEKRRGLGRGLGALIPNGPGAPRPAAERTAQARPVDVFFDQRADAPAEEDVPATAEGAGRTVFMARTGAGALRSAPAAPFHVEPRRSEQPTLPDVDEAEAPGPDLPAEVPPAAVESVEPPATGTAPDEHVPDAPAADASAAEVTSDDVLADDVPADVAPRVEPGDDLVPVPGARFLELPVTAIVPNAKQPRTVFDEEELDELVRSVATVGVLQPVVVRPIPGAADGEPGYELVMGERRWRAATAAGLGVVPAIVRDTTDDDLLRDALLENLHRSQLNPLEEAAAYAQLLDDFGCTHEELAGRIGRSRPQISNTLRLMKLPPLVQRRVAAGVLSAGHARALLALEDGAAMERLAQRIVAEGLSVRAVEEIVTLGGGAAPARARRTPAPARPELEQRAGALADRLDTRVSITMGRRKGRLTVDFAGVDDLDRILRVLEGRAPEA
ncbi:ParB/RepB/Spo0J family partition protein [Kineococcus glutinatus]|uniref:ParB-like N-terminal domain-containing protein n=1 Tax=Kineococcus glutinatus TaxID=1070872 RepID=A0ABP9H6Y7_9ACTN